MAKGHNATGSICAIGIDHDVLITATVLDHEYIDLNRTDHECVDNDIYRNLRELKPELQALWMPCHLKVEFQVRHTTSYH